MSQATIDEKSRQEMIEEEIAACTECRGNREGFRKKPDCASCIAAVDELIASLRHVGGK